jgi:hypothetical protein
MRPPAFLDDAELLDEPQGRRVAVQREWCVARGVYQFCRKAVACDFEYQCHDRGRARSRYEHAHEVRRGCQAGWPDAEVALAGGKTFRCELKRPGRKPDPTKDRKQLHLMERLTSLGHPTTWANSVVGFGHAALLAGVPLVPNWEAIAQLQDQYVAAEIRREEMKAAAKRAGAFQPKAMRGRVTPGAVARARKAGAWPV